MSTRGYRDAIVLAGPERLRTSRDRLVGFTSGFVGAGGRILTVTDCPISRDGGYRAMRQLLAGGVAEGTLVAAVSDVVAIGAMSAIRDSGRLPGPDIAVAGFDDIVTSRDITPSLTTVHVPLEEIGVQALRAVADPGWVTHEPLPLDVLIRDSTPPHGRLE